MTRRYRTPAEIKSKSTIESKRMPGRGKLLDEHQRHRDEQ